MCYILSAAIVSNFYMDVSLRCVCVSTLIRGGTCVMRSLQGGDKHGCTELQACGELLTCAFSRGGDAPVDIGHASHRCWSPLHVCDTSNKRHSIPRIVYATFADYTTLMLLYFFPFFSRLKREKIDWWNEYPVAPRKVLSFCATMICLYIRNFTFHVSERVCSMLLKKKLKNNICIYISKRELLEIEKLLIDIGRSYLNISKTIR